MKLLTMLTLFATTLSIVGCIGLNGSNSDKVQLDIILYPTDNVSPMYLIQSNSFLNKICSEKGNYITWGQDCRLKNSNVTTPITLTYAEIPLTRNQFRSIPSHQENEKLTDYAQSLPPSAWRTYTIYPQQVIEQAKREKPVTELHTKGTRVTLILNIDGQGNVYQEIEHERIIDDRFGT